MLLRIDCPEVNCGAEYAWQTVEEEIVGNEPWVIVSLCCVDCAHLGMSSAGHPRDAAATALECYRIQTTAKEESG